MKLAKRSNDAEVMTRARTKLTDDLAQDLIAEASKIGSIVNIASQCGVPVNSLRYWLKCGAEGDPRFEWFTAEFERARHCHEIRWLQKMEDIIEDDNPRTAASRVRAIEFLLKQTFPKQYGDQIYVSTMIEHQAAGFDLSALPQAVLRDFMKTLKALRAANDGADEEEVKRLVAKIKLAGGQDTEQTS